MGKIELYAIAALVVALAIAASYFYGRHDGTTVERAKWEAASLQAAQKNMDDLKQAIDKSNEISQRTLDAVGKIKIVNRTINNEVQREIKTNTVYANDCLPESGRVLWNSANRGVLPDSAAITKPITGTAQGAAADSGRKSGNASDKPH